MPLTILIGVKMIFFFVDRYIDESVFDLNDYSWNPKKMRNALKSVKCLNAFLKLC